MVSRMTPWSEDNERKLLDLKALLLPGVSESKLTSARFLRLVPMGYDNDDSTRMAWDVAASGNRYPG